MHVCGRQRWAAAALDISWTCSVFGADILQWSNILMPQFSLLNLFTQIPRHLLRYYNKILYYRDTIKMRKCGENESDVEDKEKVIQ